MPALADKRELLKARLVQDGFLVGDGLKYGLDFLAYTDHPDRVHSKYGIVVYDGMTYQQLVMHQRVCCAVNKILIVAFVEEAGKTELVQCDRFTTRAMVKRGDDSMSSGLDLSALNLKELNAPAGGTQPQER